MTELPEAVGRWLDEVLGAPVHVDGLLPGATTATVVSLRSHGGAYVLKLFSHAPFVAEDPDRAEHEATALVAIANAGIPAPQLVAFDGDGSSCGFPAVLMTRVPGSRGVGRVHAAQMVDLAARIHRLEFEVPWIFVRYNEGLETRAPSWGSDRRLWEDALVIAGSDPPPTAAGFIHRDYNSTNLLTEGGVVTGVVDWLSACHGPPAIDAARLRLDLTMDGSGGIARTVTAAFRRFHDVVDPFWDVVDAVDLLPYNEGFEAVDRWAETEQARRTRLETFIREALREL